MLFRQLIQQIRWYSRNYHKPSGTRRWHDAFGKYLLLTNTWTSGLLMVAGDLIEQEVECQRNLQSERYNWIRTGRMLVAGFGLGPLNHYFYGWLDKTLPERTVRSTMRKSFLDLFTMSPVCITYLFFSMGFMEGTPFKETMQEYKSKFFNVYMIDWFFCLPCQIINFYYVPVKYQVLYVNIMTMIYNVGWSYIKHRHKDNL